MSTRRIRSALSAAGALAAAGVLAAACSSTTTTQPSASPGASGAVSSIAAKVPGPVKSKDTLSVAADATYAPNEFIG